MLPISLSILLGYIIGSFPSALVIGKTLRGIDIRTQGSGNLGTSNAIRVLGIGPGILVFVLDLVKGVGGALGGNLVFLVLGLGMGSSHTVAALLALDTGSLGTSAMADDLLGLIPLAAGGLGAMVGHIFPLFAGFKGGKAVATGTGVVAALLPPGLLFAVPLFFITLGFSGYVSLSSLIGAFSLPLASLVFYGAIDPAATVRLGLAILIALGVLILHRKNIVRLRAGTESRFDKARVLHRIYQRMLRRSPQK